MVDITLLILLQQQVKDKQYAYSTAFVWDVQNIAQTRLHKPIIQFNFVPGGTFCADN
jgi:pterin-4a-carbinolamine dehydratase